MGRLVVTFLLLAGCADSSATMPTPRQPTVPPVLDVVVVAETVSGWPLGTAMIAHAQCPSGRKAVGGGWRRGSGLVGAIVASAPDETAAGWVVQFNNSSERVFPHTVYAVCATIR